MIGRDFHDAKVITFQAAALRRDLLRFPVYVAGMKYLPAGSHERKAALAQIAEALEWMAANQIGRGGKPAMDVLDDGHTDMAALPFLMYCLRPPTAGVPRSGAGGRPGTPLPWRPAVGQGGSSAVSH